MRYLNTLWQGFANALDTIVSVIKSMRGDPAAWESSIRKFEAQDHLKPPPSGLILFVGSSSFTLWSTMEQDLSPLPVLNRGFGGAKIGDVVHYADRIVIPYRPRAIVLFAGTNDIAGPKPATAQLVFDVYLSFVKCVQAALPETQIYYIAITPSASRWKYWHIAQEANHLIYEYTISDPRLRFIDMTDHLLGSDDKPDRSLYRFDRLHPNKKGYAKWTAVIKPLLMADLL
jgi:lysophospholipase L1-like esterase